MMFGNILGRMLTMAALGLLVASPSFAADKPTHDQAKALAIKAAALLDAKGVDAAHPLFDQDGEFKNGEIYVNVIDENGTWVIYPPNPRNEGKSVLNAKDADGKFLVQEIISTAKNQGEGWVRYRWLNPATNRIENKNSYVKSVPSQHLITYVGIYE